MSSSTERTRAWRQRNPDRAKEHKRTWYEGNKDAHNRYARERRRTSRGRAEHAARERLRKRSLPVGTVDYMEVLSADPCSYCGEIGGTVDHIEPLARGGAASWQNLTAACRKCNASKNARSLLVFLATR